MNSLISVIVPVYKSEKYLERCVGSILSQSYSNLEILLIDDGSPDRCPDICDMFEAMDERVKVFHKANGGVSSARNIGIENAKGDYICFVDSDDFIPKNAIYDLLNGITKNNCQYVAGNSSVLGRKKAKNGITAEKVIDYNENPNDLLWYIRKNGSYSPWSKLFDGSIIRENGIRFDENLKCSEDALFIRQYLLYSPRIVLIPDEVYKQNTGNVNSLSKKFYPDFCVYYIKKLEALEILLQKLSVSDNVKNNFIFDRAVHGLYIGIQHYLLNCKEKERVLSLISRDIELLNKWIGISGETVSHKEWWGEYAAAVQNRDVLRIYIAFRRKIRKMKVLSILKKPLKTIIRGIGK